MNYSTSPALKIARLAVASSYQGQGVCKRLLKFAATIALDMRKDCGIVFLTLDCYEHRVPFYEHFGFKRNQIQTSQREYDSPVSMRANLIELTDRLFDMENQ